MSRRFVLAVVFSLNAAVLHAQSRSQAQLAAARDHIAAREYELADAALSDAFASARYLLDTVNVFLWRGILEHQRGHDSLARVNFRKVISLDYTNISGLDKVAPGLDALFDSEARPYRVYPDSALDRRASWSSGPQLAYPPELLRRGLAGHAIVRAVIDTLGRVEDRSLMVLESPDSLFEKPLQQMMLAARFTPAQRKGLPVRSTLTLGFDLHPPPPASPTALVNAARDQLRARPSHPDSALVLTEQALDDLNKPSQGERVYAQLVQGVAWHKKGRDSLAAVSFDAGIRGYQDLTARGIDLAPFLKRLADSIRIARRGAAPPGSRPGAFGATSVVGAVDAAPVLVSHPSIRYAPEMQALRIGGTVIVEAALDTTGRVVPASVKIVQSPNPIFDAETKRVILGAVYSPARIHGRAAQVTIRQPVTFAPY